MASRRERAIRAAYRAERELLQVEASTLRSIRRDLDAARLATIERLALASAEWDIRQAQAIIAELERQIALWDSRTRTLLSAAMGDANTLGIQQTLAALRAGGITITSDPFISTAMLSVSQQTLPLLISGVSEKVVQDVSRVLRASVLAQETPYTAIQTIAKSIPTAGTVYETAPGPFGSAFRRAESIVRTELGRIAQTSNHATLSALAREDGGLRKEWSSVIDGNTRPSHIYADGQVRKVDEPFTVGGSRLMYPHDPRAPAKETINCRCVSVPAHEGWYSGGKVRSIFSGFSFF